MSRNELTIRSIVFEAMTVRYEIRKTGQFSRNRIQSFLAVTRARKPRARLIEFIIIITWFPTSQLSATQLSAVNLEFNSEFLPHASQSLKRDLVQLFLNFFEQFAVSRFAAVCSALEKCIFASSHCDGTSCDIPTSIE